MSAAIGALLLCGVLVTTLRRREWSTVTVFLLLVFWGIFAFFSLIRPGDPPGRLDPVSWIWVDVTMMPAVILAGSVLAAIPGRWRIPAWTYAAGALAYAVVTTLGVSAR